MENIDRWFILMAVAYALVGMVLGLWMGAQQDYSQVPVHAHLNLVGWASMALFGLLYRSYPGLAKSKLARWQFILMAVGAPIMFTGIPIAHSGGSPLIAIIGSVLVVAAFAKFLVIFARGTA